MVLIWVKVESYFINLPMDFSLSMIGMGYIYVDACRHYYELFSLLFSVLLYECKFKKSYLLEYSNERIIFIWHPPSILPDAKLKFLCLCQDVLHMPICKSQVKSSFNCRLIDQILSCSNWWYDNKLMLHERNS